MKEYHCNHREQMSNLLLVFIILYSIYHFNHVAVVRILNSSRIVAALFEKLFVFMDCLNCLFLYSFSIFF